MRETAGDQVVSSHCWWSWLFGRDRAIAGAWLMTSMRARLVVTLLLAAVASSTVQAQTRFGTIFPPLNEVLINSHWYSGRTFYDFNSDGTVRILIMPTVTVTDRFGAQENVSFTFLYAGQWKHEYRFLTREEKKATGRSRSQKIRAHFLTTSCDLIKFSEPTFPDGATVNASGQNMINKCRKAASGLKTIGGIYILNERKHDDVAKGKDPRQFLTWYTLQDDFQVWMQPKLKRIPVTEIVTSWRAGKKN